MNSVVNESLIRDIVRKNLQMLNNRVPIGVSNRHIHLSQRDLYRLFGQNYELTPIKKINQPGQFACKENVVLVGPKGMIENVRVLGPVRSQTQVEILKCDTFKLGIKGVLRISGDLADTPGITLLHGSNAVKIDEGVIVAKRHIHIDEKLSERMGLHNGQNVTVDVMGERGTVLKNVEVRVTRSAYFEMHVDLEEANACGISKDCYGCIM